ncbi:MAG: YcaO-like family protein [Microcella sp.]
MRVLPARGQHPHQRAVKNFSGRKRRPIDAWQGALRVAKKLNLQVDQPASSAVSELESYVVETALNFGEHHVVRATGKGLGYQAWASGIFEAFEHAAARGVMPGQSSQRINAVLPASVLERRDLRYRFARRVMGDRVQPVTAFRWCGTQGEVLYPAVACDFSLQLTEAQSDLLFLDRMCTGKGYASGWTRRDAEIHALNELIEHDAFSAYLLGSGVTAETPTSIDLEGHPLGEALVEKLRNLGADRIEVVLLPSVVGCVVLTWLEAPSGEAQVGLGCSHSIEVALIRSLTEAHQELAADSKGVSWLDEGGIALEHLEKYPELRARAEPKCPDPRAKVSLSNLMNKDRFGSEHLGKELVARGHPYLARQVWAAPREVGNLCVMQVVAPTLERFADIVFGFPVIPTGRLYSAKLTKALTRRELNG